MASSSRNPVVDPAAQLAEERTGSERAGWEGSDVTPADIQWLRRSRRILEDVECRIPVDELVPTPEADFFGLQPHHLPANDILTLSAFITCSETEPGEPAAEASDAIAAAASVRERRAVSKHAADKDLPQNVKQKKTAARGPKPKPLIVGEALTVTQSQTCIASEIPAAPSSHAEASNPATGETETAADPTSPAHDVGRSTDATIVGQTDTPAAGAWATEAAPSSAAVETSTEPQASLPPQQAATAPQEPQAPQPTPTRPPSPSQPEIDQAAAAQAKAKGPAAAAGSAAPGSIGPQPSRRHQGVPLRTTSGHSWESLGQFRTDWNSADSYEVTSSTLKAARQGPMAGPPPAATPESVATRMYQARVALFEASRSAESCMNKRTATFKTLLAKYKKLEAEHEALKADRKNQTGDTAQVAELLKRVAEVQVNTSSLFQAQIAAQAKAHQTEVGQLTSALSSQADEKIRVESEVKKCEGLVAQLETRATAAELEDAEKTQLFKVVRHELIKIGNMLTSRLGINFLM
ncbi:proteoglycan 4-like [Brachypodium distachyon]|uniref:proteoglycan 4-like n=1 Tax=Brachypodium distachyon TaxID=15368 RepID=UPI00053009DD|nr:proteoglycan 4-like [Brachypodium distachyon]|eukprot:XP_010233230.1 proteoglycan 4-like [Brachypodium distachyon]